jgi:hypothetical protein
MLDGREHPLQSMRILNATEWRRARFFINEKGFTEDAMVSRWR